MCIDLKGVRFTTCPETEEAWQIRAKSVTLDTGCTHRGSTLGDGQFRGRTHPLSALVVISTRQRAQERISVPDDRQQLAQRRLGLHSVLLEHRAERRPDIRAHRYSRRGADLGGELRYMNSRDRGTLTWNYLPYDSVFNSERSRVKLANSMELPGNFRFTIDAENVSDTHYFEDFAQGPEGTSTAFVQQQAMLTYRDENWKIDGQVQHYRTTDYTLQEFDRPYARLPSLGVSARFRLG